eukprot:m.189999 g.189999  ORF g.189999 m.189999 type:complete len:368 (+) comp17921_c0_seq1:244-1347(+)
MSAAEKLEAVAPKPIIEQIRPTKNKIDVNASSLIDLKVELAKKQQEFRLQSLDPELRRKSKQATKGPSFLKQNAGVLARDQRDRQVELDDASDLEKSRRALEAKAALYNRIQTQGPLTAEESEQFLVDFEAKLLEPDAHAATHTNGASDVPPPPPPPPEADDDWVEYKDAFGRDRRCLRRDLPARIAAEKDVLLGQSDHAPPPPPPPHPPPGVPISSDLLSDDMRRELDRQQWEAEATAAVEGRAAPARPVHFQGVVPGEVRQLGTGYYNFSTDEEQRAKQMEELNTIRDQTAEQRRRREAVKKRRQTAQAARVAKIRKRKGLPPLDSTQDAAAEDDGAAAGEASVDEPSTVDALLAFYKEQSKQAS